MQHYLLSRFSGLAAPGATVKNLSAPCSGTAAPLLLQCGIVEPLRCNCLCGWPPAAAAILLRLEAPTRLMQLQASFCCHGLLLNTSEKGLHFAQTCAAFTHPLTNLLAQG